MKFPQSPSGPSSFLPVLSCGHHQLLQQQIHLGCAAFSLSWGSPCDVQIEPNKSRFLLQLPQGWQGAGTEIPATFCLVKGGIRVPPPQGCQGGAEAPPGPLLSDVLWLHNAVLGLEVAPAQILGPFTPPGEGGEARMLCAGLRLCHEGCSPGDFASAVEPGVMI